MGFGKTGMRVQREGEGGGGKHVVGGMGGTTVYDVMPLRLHLLVV